MSKPLRIVGKDLEVAYQQMAEEEQRESEALQWAETTVGDVADERVDVRQGKP